MKIVKDVVHKDDPLWLLYLTVRNYTTSGGMEIARDFVSLPSRYLHIFLPELRIREMFCRVRIRPEIFFTESGFWPNLDKNSKFWNFFAFFWKEKICGFSLSPGSGSATLIFTSIFDTFFWAGSDRTFVMIVCYSIFFIEIRLKKL